MAEMVAALYVETGGVYFGVPGVDPWDIERDARLYRGPHPVVAHPPCNRWSKMAVVRGTRDGRDGGCFEHALWAVREFGGVLEHPAQSFAWRHFGLPRPPARGWSQCLGDDGWCCEVDQRWYGHEMRKTTWLYVSGECPEVIWGPGERSELNVRATYGCGKRQAKRSRTPVPFRDLLLDLARSSAKVVAA